MTTVQKIAEIEAEMARTQKNKATNSHLGVLKAKIAKLKRELIEDGSKGSGGAGEGFDVNKSGDTRVGMVGFPSVGKSTLLTKLTGSILCCFLRVAPHFPRVFIMQDGIVGCCI